jgi:nucleotide-binding universal stress UspA family protein
MTGTTANGPRGRIVVGVDGSVSSKDALRWAARQAELTRARVEAVMAWSVSPAAFPLTTPAPLAHDMGPQVEEQLERIISQVRREFPTVEISNVAREEWAGRALLAVVGLLLGSVSEYCVTHARCPVVVIRHGKDAAVGGDAPAGPSSEALMKGTRKVAAR